MLKTVNEKINKIRFNSTWEEAVFKATKSEETPPKRKHLRNLILRSWEVRGADDFFRELSSSNRPVLTKVTVAYKTLICVHNLIQEGHPACLVDANRQRHLFTALHDQWRTNQVAYAQLVTQYATYVLKRLDFHTERREWICDKEGNLDWDYFLERFPDGGDIDYVLNTVQLMCDVLSVAGTLMTMIMAGISMDQRVSKHGVNACVAHPLVPLCTDTFTIYTTVMRLLSRGWTLYDDLTDAELDTLEERTKRFERGHDILRKLFEECMGIQYVTSLTTVPSLPEDCPRFGPPKRGKRREAKKEPAQGALVQLVDESRLRDIDSFANQVAWAPFSGGPGTGNAEALLAAQRMAAEEEAAQRLLSMQRQQNDAAQRQQQSETAAMLQFLTDKIGREREMAAGVFAAKDAQIERWKTMAGMLSNENKDLAALLKQLLDENEELRRRIAEERAAHRRFVRGILDRHVAAADTAIATAVKRHQQADHNGNTNATGADMGSSVAAALQWARSLDAARDSPVALVGAISHGGGCAQSLLDNVKGAATALRDPHAPLLCDTATNVAVHLNKLIRSAADGDAAASKKLLADLEAWLASLMTQSKRLTEEESYQQLNGEEWNQCVSELSRMRAELAARAAQAAQRLRDAAGQATGVARSVAEACEAIAGASNGLVAGVLDNVERRINDGGRKFKRDGEWVAQLLALCEAVAAAVDALAEAAVAVAISGPEDPKLYDALLQRADALRTASLALVEHLKTRYSDASSTARMGAAYRTVTAAIKALLDSVTSYRRAQQELAQYNQSQAGAFQEDRTAILEKRALVHRLKANVQRKRTSTENLVTLLSSGSVSHDLRTGNADQ